MNSNQNQEKATSNSINDDPSPVADPKRNLLEKLWLRLSIARDRLVDRNLRNRLISTNLNSTRTKNIRFSNKNNEQIFTTLFVNRQEMIFGAVEDAVDNQDLFENYPEIAFTANSISYDKLDAAIRYKNVLFTTLEKVALQKKLKSIYCEAKDYEEEQGVNILFIALGFVRWFEDDSSEIERFAPLVLLPVELIRDGAKDKFKLKPREEDLFTNISLKLWLKEQHSIDLPDIPEDESWAFKDYCQKVNEAIKKESRWSVLEDEVVSL
jgi:hypothetical protein